MWGTKVGGGGVGDTQDLQGPPAQSNSLQSQMKTNCSFLNACFSCFVSFWFWKKGPIFHGWPWTWDTTKDSLESLIFLPLPTKSWEWQVCTTMPSFIINGCSVTCFQNTVSSQNGIWRTHKAVITNQATSKKDKDTPRRSGKAKPGNELGWRPVLTHRLWASQGPMPWDHHCSSRIRTRQSEVMGPRPLQWLEMKWPATLGWGSQLWPTQLKLQGLQVPTSEKLNEVLVPRYSLGCTGEVVAQMRCLLKSQTLDTRSLIGGTVCKVWEVWPYWRNYFTGGKLWV